MKQGANTSEIIKIKEAFPSLGANKINQINSIIKGNFKIKSHIQMTTKSLSRKHVIIPMSSANNLKFMKNRFLHVANINRSFRNIKSEVLVDFIQLDPLGIMVVTNKVATQLDLQIIEQYVKNADNINSLHVEVPQLPQSKSYLKIIGIPYFSHDNSQDRLTSSNVENIIKQNQIFNNVILPSKP